METNLKDSVRKEYHPPKIQDYGDIQSLTYGMGHKAHWDAGRAGRTR